MPWIVAVAFATADPSTPGGLIFGVDSGLAGALGGCTDDRLAADVATLLDELARQSGSASYPGDPAGLAGVPGRM